jgi:hypothetical protein
LKPLPKVGYFVAVFIDSILIQSKVDSLVGMEQNTVVVPIIEYIPACQKN